MKKFVSLLVVSLFLVSCSSTAGVNNLSAEEFLAKSQEPNVVVLDVRTSGEFAAGHLANAINIDVEAGDFDSEISKLDKSLIYAVYCRSGRRSEIASEKMSKSGFKNIFNLEGGGFQNLAELGAPTS